MATARQGMMGVLAVGAALLAGCALYHRKPLPTRPDLARTPAVTVAVRRLGVPGLRPQSIDPAKGLTEINVVTLAVADNPQLRALRLQAGVARAQLLEAGLLPDPQLTGGVSRTSFFTGYSATLTQDIQALVTRGAAESAAKAHLRQVNLGILWQEWQVAERARSLYIETEALRALHGVLNRQRQLLARLYRQDQASLSHHYVTVSDVTADFIAWNSAEAAWRSYELQENTTRHALDELLGLAPDVRLRLRGMAGEHSVTVSRYRSALAALPRRRPDLLALQAGYHSEQQRLREAILAQFPLISAGVVKARDAKDAVQSLGFNVTLTLPLFNRNRGPIAIARASRAYLYQAYQARLDATTNQANQVWTAMRIMERQLKTLDARLAGLERGAAAARESLGRGTLSLAAYTRVAAIALSTRAEQIRLRASLGQAQAALAMLLAQPF